MRIWDIHVHFPRNFQNPDADPQAAVDHLAERLRETHVVKASLLCGGRFGLTYERSLEMAMKHEDLFVPHAVVDPEETTYERIHELKRVGYRGLKIIGAHLGGTGNYDEAASVARWRRWVFFDMSGGRTIERHAVERGLIGKEIPIEKLIFGSDCAADEIHEHVERFIEIFDGLGLTEEEKDVLWYRNAAELFGLEEPVWAEE